MTGTGTLSLNRNATGADTDSNAADFSGAAPTPTNAGPVAPGPLAATNPGTKNLTRNQATSFQLAASGGSGSYTWTSTALPAGLSLAPNGTISGTPTATGTTSVTATVTDSAAATAQTTFDIVVTAAGATTPIADIQGTGDTTPLAGQTVTTQGVVTASYPTGGLNGFYIQKPGADTANASDAVFVYGGASGFATYPAVGDSVSVTGSVSEAFGQTQVTATNVSPIASLGAVVAKTVVPGTDCALPGTSCLTGAALDTAREVAEGEAFQPTAPWTLTDVYDGGPAYNNGTNGTPEPG